MRLFLIAILIGIVAPVEKDLTGTYECSGVTNLGMEYTVSLVIQKRADNYFFTWNGGSQVGMGFRTGETLNLTFIEHATNAVGVEVYQLKNGELQGTWAIGDGKTYPETCTLPNLRRV